MNRVHPTAIIGPDVNIGTGNTIGPNVIIVGRVKIGNGNWIGPNAVIGTPAQMRGYSHVAAWDGDLCDGEVEIGSGNIIREFVTIHSSISGITRVADGCYFMTQCHVPHDAQIEDDVTLSNSVQIGGHSIIQEGANIGLGAVVHQRIVIGSRAMVGMGSVVTRNVLPFSLIYGSPARLHGGNLVGMHRAGVVAEVAQSIAEALKNSEIEVLRKHIPIEMKKYEKVVTL